MQVQGKRKMKTLELPLYGSTSMFGVQCIGESGRLRMKLAVFAWLVVFACLLAACGGGGGQSKTTTDSVSGVQVQTSTAQTGVASASSSAGVDSLLGSVGDITSLSSVAALSGGVLQPAISIVANPTLCKLMNFKDMGCWLDSDGYYIGISPSALGPEIPGCQTLQANSVTATTMPASGSWACYQYVADPQANFPTQVQVALPNGMSALAELYFLAQNKLGMKVADDRTHGPLLVMNYTPPGLTRMILVLRPKNGVAGQPVNIGVGLPAPAVANSTPETASVMVMNQAVNGTIDEPGVSSSYYFYPLQTGQTIVEFMARFSANQRVSYFPATRVGDSSYELGTEVSVAQGQSGVIWRIPGFVANASGDSSLRGIMVRASGINSSAPAKESFSVRIGVPDGYITSPTNLVNNENLPRLYLDTVGVIKVFSYVIVNATIIDSFGNPVENEMIGIRIKAGEVDNTVVVYTDAAGKISYTQNFAACSGLGPHPNTSYSIPPDNWLMWGFEGTVDMILPYSQPAEPNGRSNQVHFPFFRICREARQ